ncbi:MAG: hypothetical protein I8H76_09735 [Burkholderiales bacterium]|nr:hypothetical protein [Burkholderiales bacterium]MBH2017677.1 hypothetical protein [Burkholderiales bacterium]
MQATRETADPISACLVEIDARLSALDEALASNDTDLIEQRSQALQHSLAQSLGRLQQAAQGGPPLSEAQLQRLGHVRARCMQQQQAVHRASASFGRTLGALFPDAPGVGSGAPAQTAAARALRAYR